MKIGKNRLFAVLLTALMVLPASGCGKEEKSSSESSSSESSSEISADENNDSEKTESPANGEAVKSDGYEKFSQLQIGMTESEVNEILGEPTKVDKAYYYYNITVNGQDMELTVWINTTSGLVTNIYGDFSADEYRAEFVDSETDLSAADDLDSGKIASYDDCVSAFKTQGYLIGIDEEGVKRYLWVDSNDGHICITFKPDGSVKTYVGYC